MPMQIFLGVEAVYYIYYGIVQVENQNPALCPASPPPIPSAGLTLIGASRLMSLTFAG